MNSPKCRISDVKIMLAKCATLDDPLLLKEALLECIAILENEDIQIEKAVDKLKFLFQHRQLDIKINTNVTISKELFNYIKEKIAMSTDSVNIVFNSDDCIFNSISIIDSLNLTNIIKSSEKKLILIVDDSVFNLKMLFQKLKVLLFPNLVTIMPDFSGNYATFEIENYFIVFCKNGKIGYDIFKTKKPYAIITDNDMPFMNGHDMSDLILKSNSTSKIIMISGNSSTCVDDLITEYPNRIKFLNKGDSNSLFQSTFIDLFLNEFIEDKDKIKIDTNN